MNDIPAKSGLTDVGRRLLPPEISIPFGAMRVTMVDHDRVIIELITDAGEAIWKAEALLIIGDTFTVGGIRGTLPVRVEAKVN